MISGVDSNRFFSSLQIFRGIAALMVVFHHQWNAFSHFMGYENHHLEFLAAMGKYGVDFFFLLSGFIITYTSFHKRGQIQEIRPYFLNRLLRIYIPYLPIGIAMLVLYTMFESVSAVDREISWLTSMTLIPHGSPALSVAWTLIYEMMFYIIFTIWFITRRGFSYFIVIWSLMILDRNYFHFFIDKNHESIVWSYLFSFYNLAFILGHLIARLYMKTRESSKSLLGIGIGLTFFVLYLRWVDLLLFPHAYNFLMFICFGLMIWGSLSIDMRKLNKRDLFMILGNASYSIYLIHNPLISILVRVFPRSDNLIIAILAFIFVFLLCCLSGIIYSKVFEEFLLKKIKRSIAGHMVLITR